MNQEDKKEQPRFSGREFFPKKINNDEVETADFRERPDLELEKSPEKTTERQSEVLDNEDDSPEIAQKIAPVTAVPVISANERERAIESIMANGLEDLFLGLSPDKQLEFKKNGEETAEKINKLLDQAKVKIKKIVDLLKKWLSFLPGAGKFFIEQEAKIRADKITELRK